MVSVPSHDEEPSEIPIAPTHNLFALLAHLRDREREAKEQEDRYRDTFDHAPIGVAHVGQDLRFLSVSDGFCEFIGYSREELLGMTFPSITHPDDLQPDLAQARRLSVGELDGYALEKRYRRKDGGTVWGHLTVTMLRDVTGAALFQVAVVVDLTERREAEASWLAARVEAERQRARLDALLRETPSGISVAEAGSGRLLYHNDEAVRLLRHPMVSPVDQATFSHFGALHADGTHYAPEEYPLARALEGEVVSGEEMLYCRGDGMLTQLSVSAAPVRDADGEIILAVQSFEDLSERNRLTEELRQAEIRAESANRTKSAFLAMMSHELRTPLTSILGFSDLLLLGIPEHVGVEAEAQVERIRSSARHLLGLVDEVLSFARMESGARFELAFDPVDLEATIATVIGMLEPAARGKGLILFSNVEPRISIRTDVQRLQEILIHLTANAIKYTRVGEVEISARHVGDAVEIEVRDTGIGIAPEHIASIFDPFWQVHGPGGRPMGGVGMGLTVAQRLSRLLGGDLSVESILGEGSSFLLILPAEPED